MKAGEADTATYCNGPDGGALGVEHGHRRASATNIIQSIIIALISAFSKKKEGFQKNQLV